MFEPLAHFFDAIYRRTPPGLARICVAGIAGALCAVSIVGGRDSTVLRQYWILFASVGLALGSAGGVMLRHIEYRQSIGEGPPREWVMFSRIARMTGLLVLISLTVVLLYTMLQLVRFEHLYGF